MSENKNMMTETTEAAVAENGNGLRFVQPRVDIRETADQYVLEAELPGVADKDVDIALEKDQLTLTAVTGLEAADNIAHAEFTPANFRRTFTVSEAIDRDNIGASMTNGVLTLTLPKRPEQQPRKISVQAA